MKLSGAPATEVAGGERRCPGLDGDARPPAEPRDLNSPGVAKHLRAIIKGQLTDQLRKILYEQTFKVSKDAVTAEDIDLLSRKVPIPAVLGLLVEGESASPAEVNQLGELVLTLDGTLKRGAPIADTRPLLHFPRRQGRLTERTRKCYDVGVDEVSGMDNVCIQ